jgi:hypothetical protein
MFTWTTAQTATAQTAVEKNLTVINQLFSVDTATLTASQLTILATAKSALDAALLVLK